MTKAVVLCALVLSFTVAAAAFGDAIAVAPQPVVPDTDTDHWRPTVSAATNGDRFLVTWHDIDGWDPLYSVRFRMYAADGTPLQLVPSAMPTLPLTSGAAAPHNFAPAAVWTGQSWFIASADVFRPKGFADLPPFAMPTTLYGAVLSESGDEAGSPMRLGVLPEQGIATGLAWNGHVIIAGNLSGAVLATPDGSMVRQLSNTVYPLASAGGTFLVSVRDNVSYGLAIVDGSGDVVRTLAPHGTLSPYGSVFAIVAHGDEYGLLVGGNVVNGIIVGGSRLVTLDSAGNVKTDQPFPISPDARDVEMTWSGGSYVIAYCILASASGPSRLCLSRADNAAASRCTDGNGVAGIALAANDRKLLVAWNLGEHFIKTAFGDAGGLPDLDAASDATTHPEAQLMPSIVRDDDGVSVAWWREDGSVLAGGVDAGGGVRTPRVLGTPAYYRQILSRGRTSTLAVWQGVGAQGHIYAQELPDGKPIDFGVGGEPAVAFDGDDWLVVWSTGTLLSALVHPGQIGASIARAVLPSPRSQFEPALASRGRDFLVAWKDQHEGATRAALVDRSGVAAGSEFDVMDRSSAEGVAVAASGGTYLICAQKLAPTSSFTVRTLTPDILLGTASVPASTGLLRVHERPAGGFGVLWGFARSSELRYTALSMGGDISSDSVVPRAISEFSSRDADFFEDRDGLTVVYASYSWFPRLFMETFTFRRRAVGMR